jgi:heme/copper-type cytochrome/quinol oxidase subunit 2
VVVDTLTPELEATASGDSSKFELEFTNITDGPAILTVDAIGERGCKPTLSENQLPQNRITAVEVEISNSSCNSGDEVLKLKLSAELTAGASQVFLVDPKGSAAEKPEWKALFAFPVLLLICLALAGWFLFKGWKSPETVKPARDRFWQPLTAIDVSAWKFNDNWATNVTAAGALLTGIFGATTAKAFLGDDAESLTALATVGAAVTAILVAAAPIVVFATKSYAEYEEAPGDFFTVGGVLLGAATVTTAAVGQLGIIAFTATELDIGLVAKVAIWIGFLLGTLLVVVYARRSLKDLFERGTEESPDDPEVEIEAAAVIAKELQALRKTIAVLASEAPADERQRWMLDSIESFEEVAPVVLPRRRRARSALL